MTRLPAEWEPHERTVMCWPARTDLWADQLDLAEHAYAAVARAIADFEPVTMLAPAPVAERAAHRCGGGVEIVEFPIDDSWFRDSGPIYVFDDDGRRVAIDWEFNAWGEKVQPYEDDAAAARRFATLSGHAVRSVDMVLEGGSVTGNGAGTLATTAQCLLHPNRNPSLSQAQIERTVLTEFGAERLIWLPYGLAFDADTDGHVDNVAAFAGPSRLVLQGCADPDEPDSTRLAINARAVAETTNAGDHALDAVVVPVLPFAEIGGRRIAVPYLNYYIGNGFVAVPTCGHDADAEMLALIGEQYPGRAVLGLDVGAVLAFGGGGIHCITQQIPAVTPDRPS